MPNMKAIITGHNKKLLEKESSQYNQDYATVKIKISVH